MARGNGCTEYMLGRITLTVAFPNHEKACRHCDFCKREDGIRFRCMLIWRLIYDLDGTLDGCPIEWEEKDNV